MDVYQTMKKVNAFAGYFMLLVLLSTFIVPVFASGTTGYSSIASAMKKLCNDVRVLLVVAAMLLIVAAAVVYAIGQVVGAETRARASVWATAMITGAVIGLVIYLLTPIVIGSLWGKAQTGNPCEYVA